MQTRRYPRTMNEAFGPYTSRKLHPMGSDKRPRAVRPDVIIYALLLMGLAAVLAFK